MILSDIKRYLEKRRQATLADIAIHFDSDSEAVRGMLEVWIKKGKVRRQPLTSSCGSSCSSCDSAATEIYLWIESGESSEVMRVLPPGCKG